MEKNDYETRNVRQICHNIDNRLVIEKYEYRFSAKTNAWTNSYCFKICDESYSNSYFGDSIVDIKFRKDTIVFTIDSATLNEYGTDNNYGLYRPVSNLIEELINKLGKVPKGLKITIEFF